MKMAKQNMARRMAMKVLMKAGKTREEAEDMFNELSKVPIAELKAKQQELKRTSRWMI